MYQPTTAFLQHSLVARFQSIPSLKKNRIPSLWKEEVVMFDHLLQLTVNGICRKHLVHIATAPPRQIRCICRLVVVIASRCLGPQKNERRLLKFVVPKPQSWLVILKYGDSHGINAFDQKTPPKMNLPWNIMNYAQVVITSIYKINCHFTR